MGGEEKQLRQTSSSTCAVALVGSLACVALVIYFGINVVKPYMENNSWKEKGDGEILGAQILYSEEYECDCSGLGEYGCRSTFPCTQISIGWGGETNDTFTHSGFLYMSLDEYKRNKDCFHTPKPCYKSAELNKLIQEDLLQQYTIGLQIESFYSDEDNTGCVAYRKEYSSTDVILYMIIPAAVLIVFIILLCAMGCWRVSRGIKCCC